MFHVVKHHASETLWEIERYIYSACVDVILLVNAGTCQNHFHEGQQLLWNGIFWL